MQNETKRRLRQALIAATAALAFAAPAAAKDMVIHAGTLIDGVSATPKKQVSILIKDDRISGVQSGFVTPAGAEVIDLSQATVLPGLIETHDHISSSGDRRPLNRFTQTEGDAVISAMLNARREIELGFTTVRDVGSGPLTAPALIRGINSGRIVGPRLWTALEALGPTGGHSDRANGMRPDISFEGRDAAIIDGPEEAKIKVREHRRRGATVIKIMPSGGVASIGDDPHHMTMADDEMKSAIDTAHELGMKVAAHAHGKKAIDHVIMAGVDSVEHGTYADAETYKLMKARGTFLVPTLLVADAIYQTAIKTPELLPPTVADKAIAVTPTMIGNAGRAYRAGVKIAFGTDQGATSNRNKGEEFALLVKAGLPPMEAIFTATRNAAELIGTPEDIGSVQTGRYADIVAVQGDPIADITELQRVRFVMKGGEVLKKDGVMQR
ncbi:imidazolonepropionase-like amidohydrolase [Sphingomonas zeicaulis]|uniref:metal-dependent hydrolase family protein n=1 Tax=Sphingomonas zeicaulis TaxID=1632740 RepID=UPI003D2240B4